MNVRPAGREACNCASPYNSILERLDAMEAEILAVQATANSAMGVANAQAGAAASSASAAAASATAAGNAAISAAADASDALTQATASAGSADDAADSAADALTALQTIEGTIASVLASDIGGKVDKLTTAGFYLYMHNGSTQGEVQPVVTPTAATIPIRDSDGRMQAADPASGATDKTLVTANWVSQTGNSAPNNLAHRNGNETYNGQKTFAGYFRIVTANRIDNYNETTFMDPATAANGDYFISRKAVKVGSVGSVEIDALRIVKDNTGIAYHRTIGLFGSQYGNNCGLTFIHYDDGRPDKIQARVKNADGTIKVVTIAEGDL